MFTKTNGHARDLLAAYELPYRAIADLNGVDGDLSTPRFFEYRGSWYDVHDGFTVTDNMPSGVEAWQGESYFSAVGIRYVDDYQRVVVTYYHG